MKNKIFFWIAILSFAMGILFTVRAVRLTGPSRESMEKKLATLAEVSELAGQRAQDRAAIARFDTLREKSPRSLEKIAARVAKGVAPEIRTLETRSAAEGWTLRRVSITFDDLPLTTLSRFIENATADTERPPWVLTECGITASDRTPGNGHIVLVMESLAKTSEMR